MRAPLPVLSLALCGLSLIPAAVLADDSQPETVVITATQLPTPEDEVASDMTVITADEIQNKQERTLPDVLEGVPGLNIVQTGGPGGQASVFMRGTNSDHTKVFIDGIDVSDPSNPNATYDFAQMLTDDIERVEVLRGPQSGLYGSDAIGGVINIITQSGSGPARLHASAEGGSFDTFNQSAGLLGSTGGFHYSTNVEHFHSGATPVTPLDLLAPGEKRNDDYYDNLTGSTKLGYVFGDGLDLGLVARQTSTHLRFTGDDYDVPPYTGVPNAQQSESDTMETYARTFAHLSCLDGRFDQTLGFAYTRKRTAGYLQADLPASVSLDTGERDKVSWQGIVKASRSETVVFGAEHARDAISAPLLASDSISSGYGELQSRLGRGFDSALNVRYDSSNRAGGKVTYRIAPTYMIAATGTRIRATWGTGFKIPTLSELFQSFPAFNFFANPNLKPETSEGYDVGIEQALGGQARIGVTYFDNHLHNLIDENATFTSYANVGRATTSGVESFIAYQPWKSFSLRIDYTYTEAFDDISNEQLERRPKHKASVDASWQVTPRLYLDSTVLMVSSWLDVTRDSLTPYATAPGYTTVNLAAHYDLTASLKVFARVDNLLDRRYEEPLGYLRPGLGVFGGVDVKL